MQPIAQERVTNKKTKAAVYIQRMYRRFKQRHTQLDSLKKRNQMQKLMAEEDAKYKETQRQLDEAARVVARHWRKFKARKLTSLAEIARANQRSTFGTTIAVVYLPSIKTCYICKQRNANRLCVGVSHR